MAGPIWEAIDGARAGGDVHVLVLCNPTSPSGPVYRMFTVDRAYWKTITIDAFETPNLKGFTLDYLRQLPAGLSEDHPVFQYKPWPQLVTRWWVYDMYHRYGDDSPVWQSRVCGQFPTQAEDSLYPIAWLERAKMGSFLADRWPDVTTRNVIVGYFDCGI